jgi:hypothetical protein
MLPIRVNKIREVARGVQNGQAAIAYEVEYFIGPHGPFYEVFPKEGFSPHTARAFLVQKAEDFNVLIGPEGPPHI